VFVCVCLCLCVCAHTKHVCLGAWPNDLAFFGGSCGKIGVRCVCVCVCVFLCFCVCLCLFVFLCLCVCAHTKHVCLGAWPNDLAFFDGSCGKIGVRCVFFVFVCFCVCVCLFLCLFVFVCVCVFVHTQNMFAWGLGPTTWHFSTGRAEK
jgi:hypothetical protein